MPDGIPSLLSSGGVDAARSYRMRSKRAHSLSAENNKELRVIGALFHRLWESEDPAYSKCNALPSTFLLSYTPRSASL